MLDKSDEVLYIGKAKNLKKRVASYFQKRLDAKTLQLVKQIQGIQVTITRNEREALLLESSLIKAQNPRYNVVFKDDKSYPYLKLDVRDTFPRLSFHRGVRQESALFFGPYPSAHEAREALTLLQSIFRLRQCDETFFSNRTRPCLQYQIKRCTAPCVGYIDKEEYAKDVEDACLFLRGKSKDVILRLIHKMEQHSEHQDFEEAARIRDQIALLRSTQERQIIVGDMKDVDVLGFAQENAAVCIHILVIRQGRMLGSRQYYPNKDALLLEDEDFENTMLEAFLLQHYGVSETMEREEIYQKIPKTILLPIQLNAEKDVAAILSERAGRAVQLAKAFRGDRLRWVKMAIASAKQALRSHRFLKQDLSARFEALQAHLSLEEIPERIECFDVSHTLGEATVVSCVVFEREGPIKTEYRRFNIRAKTGGDDCAALKEGLTRHFTRLKSEGGQLPDILVVDGGKGQLSVAKSVLEELQVVGVTQLAVAKGPQRKAGLETVFLSSNGQSLKLELSQQALLLIQQVRDEAHRFAIAAHRGQRVKRRTTSVLENVQGIGNQRRIRLLQHFGGLQEILQANVEELAKVPGIHHALAERLYESLHGH